MEVKGEIFQEKFYVIFDDLGVTREERRELIFKYNSKCEGFRVTRKKRRYMSSSPTPIIVIVKVLVRLARKGGRGALVHFQ